MPKKIRFDFLNCTDCNLHKYRRNIVVGRGTIPADILFIGEAPGKTENLTGKAFTGESGNLLKKMFHMAMNFNCSLEFGSYYITNTVLCRPCDSKISDNREPYQDEVYSCMYNIQKIIKAVNPKIIICIGSIADNFYKKFPQYVGRIYHPSFLSRTGGMKSPFFLTTCRDLANYVKCLEL